MSSKTLEGILLIVFWIPKKVKHSKTNKYVQTTYVINFIRVTLNQTLNDFNNSFNSYYFVFQKSTTTPQTFLSKSTSNPTTHNPKHMQMAAQVNRIDRCMTQNDFWAGNQRFNISSKRGLHICNGFCMCKHHLNGISSILARWLSKINQFISTMHFV